MTAHIQNRAPLAPGTRRIDLLRGLEFEVSRLVNITSHHLGPMPQQGVDAVLEGNLHGIAEELHVLHEVVKDHGVVGAHGR